MLYKHVKQRNIGWEENVKLAKQTLKDLKTLYGIFEEVEQMYNDTNMQQRHATINPTMNPTMNPTYTGVPPIVAEEQERKLDKDKVR